MRDKKLLIIKLFITCCHLQDILSGKQHYASAALTSFASFGSMVNSNTVSSWKGGHQNKIRKKFQRKSRN